MTDQVKQPKQLSKVKNPWLVIAVFLLTIMVIQQFYSVSIFFEPKYIWLPGQSQLTNNRKTASLDTEISKTSSSVDISQLESQVIAKDGVELPIKWGDIGKKLTQNGVIDIDKFEKLFGTLTSEQKTMLTDNWDKPVTLTKENSRFVLDVLWAFGLANKNPILDDGEMQKNGKVGNYASTGGWRLSTGTAMDHYSKYNLVSLDTEQQKMVEDMAKGIYRPCCGNSVYFPDCNHGMAMLGLLELMAANNVKPTQAWDVALKVNSLWFEDTYLKLATYFKENGKDWNQVDPKIVLSANYTSSSGFANIRKQIKSLPQQKSGGGGCGV